MTDEEKAKEITMKHFEITECCFENLLPNKSYVYNFYNGVLKGLAEGKKEKCLEQNNDGTIRPCEVMKENEQLKAQNESLADTIISQNEQNEKMKCCGNCKHGFSEGVGCMQRARGMICDNKDKWELAE